jgi:small-conductance mechanosensitive channel
MFRIVRRLFRSVALFLLITVVLASINFSFTTIPLFLIPTLPVGIVLLIYARSLWLQYQRINQAESQDFAVDAAMEPYLQRALAYQKQIDTLAIETNRPFTRNRFEKLAQQVDGWLINIRQLSHRLTEYRQNALIQADLRQVPQTIAQLEQKLPETDDPQTRRQLEDTLSRLQKQAQSLHQLENTMTRAELQLESTVSALGTIYSQMLSNRSSQDERIYQHLSAEVNEEVATLEDLMAAFEEVQQESARLM